MTNRRDIHAEITQSIVDALEAGVRPWVRPWVARGNVTRPLRANGVRYRGINVVNLWLVATTRGYASPYWLTFRQARELGARVRKGERAAFVVYAARLIRAEANEDGEIAEREIPFLRGYPVFNAEQIAGLPALYYPQALPPNDAGKDARAEAFIANTGAVIRYQGNQPLYSPSQDVILCPPIGAFDCSLSYYETLTHELVHFSGHPGRLARFGMRWPGISEIALEELIAEIGAAFLCSDLGLSPKPRADHAAYIADWLRAIRNDKRLIFAAATKAQQAADFLHALQPSAETGAAA